MDGLERLAERARQAPLSDDDYATLKAALHTLGYVALLVEDKSVKTAVSSNATGASGRHAGRTLQAVLSLAVMIGG